MTKFLPGALAVVFEETDILNARVALEVEDALGSEAEKVRDLIVAGAPQVPVVARIFDQHFVSTDRVHAVIDAVAAPAGFALDAVERLGMHDGTRGPGNARRVGRLRDHLQRGGRAVAKTAGGLGTWSSFGRIIAGDD